MYQVAMAFSGSIVIDYEELEENDIQMERQEDHFLEYSMEVETAAKALKQILKNCMATFVTGCMLQPSNILSRNQRRSW